MQRLKDKVAIVTGASSGIGRAIAIGFAREGAKVACADLRKTARPEGYETDIQKDTDKVIHTAGGGAIFVKTDVTVGEEVASLLRATVERYGQLDIMVNNAGVFTRLSPIHETTEEEYDFTMKVNAKGVWHGCQQAIIQFLKQGNGGKIINIVSIGGLVGLANEPAYCASKGAVANLTRQLAIDYGPHRINVNGICPNYLTTAMCRPYYDDPSICKMVEDATPMRRWGSPEEIVGPAIFLASSEADYVTGSMLIIDGGYTAR
jgi:NAD(P)-dependent dehydrogenase (short-subunit alcohol dehydrogenase family)